MSDDDIYAELLSLSDNGLAAVIFAATGVPATLRDLRCWRAALQRLLHRRRRFREREPEIPVREYYDYEIARELIVDMLTSPEFLLLATAVLASQRVMSVAITIAARTRYSMLAAVHNIAPPRSLDCAHAYACALMQPGGATIADFWIASRVPPAARAVLCASTREYLTFWIDRLASARASRNPSPSALIELAERGEEVMSAHPDLELASVKIGSPLGLWPPPPSDDDGGGGPSGP